MKRHQQSLMGFTVFSPEPISASLFALLISQKYPRLTFTEVRHRIGDIVVIEGDKCLTIKTIGR
jgi:hypothetical protein